MRPVCALHLACLALLGCAQAPTLGLRPEHAENDPVRAAAVLARLGAPAPAPPPLAVGVTTGEQPTLIAVDARSGALRFRRRLDATQRPVVTATRLLTTHDGALLGLSLEDGETRFSMPLPLPVWVGAAAIEGGAVVVTRSEGTAHRGRSEVRALDDAGATRWALAVDGEVGAPVASGGLVVVPLRRHALSVLDAATGRELARFVSRDDSLAWARIEAGALLTGDRALYAIDADYASERAGVTAWPLPEPLLPGATPYPLRDAVPRVDAAAAGGSGTHLRWTRDAAGRPKIGEDRVYTVRYRHVLATDGQGVLRWAATVEADVVGARAVPGGLWAVLEDGKRILLRAEDGARSALGAFDARLASATLVGTPAPPAQRAAPLTLRQGLLDIAHDRDARLVSAQALAVRALAALPDPELSATLVSLYAEPVTSPGLRDVIRAALSERGVGIDHLLAALEGRHDFLRGKPVPPLSLLVPVLRRRGEQRAADAMRRHLFDPATPVKLLPDLAAGLGELGGEAGRAALLTFLRRYRADSALRDHPEVLTSIAALLSTDADDALRAELASIARAGEAHPELVALVARLLSRETPSPTVTQAARTVASVPRALPRRLSPATVRATFHARSASLSHCAEVARATAGAAREARIVVLLQPDGTTDARTYVPDDPDFIRCVDPVIAALRFDPFAGHGQVVSYTIPMARPAPLARPDATAAAPWWQRFAEAATPARPVPRGTPWWAPEQPWYLPTAHAAHAAPAHATRPHAVPAEHADLAPVPATDAGAPAPAEDEAEQDPPASDARERDGADAWWVPVRPPEGSDAAGPPQR